MAKKKDEKKTEKKFNGHHYNASDITVLEGLEPVRKRPGMYIGTTGPDGLHHLITEIFDNSRDEAMGGFADHIEVALLPGNRVRVVDNGRGIPIDMHKKTKVSALETIMTTLHAGGKFGGEGYIKATGGLHGVGASVVNALSIYMKAEVHREGGRYVQEYSQGKSKAKVMRIGTSKLTGTIITFEPDKEIFKEISFEWNKVVSHMRQQAYLVKKLRIAVLDARGYSGKLDLNDAYYLEDKHLEIPSQTFYFEGGLESMIGFYNEFQKPIHRNIFYIEKEAENVSVEVALQYVDDIAVRLVAFANNIYNSEGGTHVTGFKTTLTRTLNAYGRKNNIIKESEDNFTGDDVLEGLTAVISVKLREIQFEGQTKGKLGSMEAQTAVSSVFGDAFAMFLEENPDDARHILGKVLLAMKARKAAKAAKDSVLRKGALEGLTLPGKLADCQSNDPSESELFIVEGDSAGGCFSGDTKVALVDGRSISFTDLVKEHKEGKENYCYTINNKGGIEVALIENPRITKKETSIIKIVLDNNEEIVCTPDHYFMLRDGSYKKAEELTKKDSLMPLRRQLSHLGKRITIKGYELAYSPSESRWIFTHLLADKYNLARDFYRKELGDTIHHKDFNKRNNNPDNLIRMDKQEHLIYHTNYLKHTLHSEATKEKARQAHKLPSYRNKIREIMLAPKMRALLSSRAKKQWGNPAYKLFMLEKFLAFYQNNKEYRLKNNRLLNQVQKAYWALAENREAQSKRTKTFFENHPEYAGQLKEMANKQWNNKLLRVWRAKETEKQWTREFRTRRKLAYNQTYLRKALRVLNDLWRKTGALDEIAYNKIRKETDDRSLIRLDTIRKRFFEGDEHQLEEAVVNFNHRIKKILFTGEKMDVYDLEVARTHNFALASGIFVHNSSKQGRDRRTQAILPLKGKILNVERARLDKMLASVEIKSLVLALGTLIGDTFNIDKLRYHKIIIATDADVDGAHIRTLILTLFYRHFRPLLDGGFIYIAQPPLYKIKRGKEVNYAYSEEEMKKILGKDTPDITNMVVTIEANEDTEATEEASQITEDLKAKRTIKPVVSRYKGLGEMNPEELWETTMDPEKRLLLQVNIEDAQEADKVFDILMGTDVPSRKSFIQSNAHKAQLDI